MKTVKLLSVLTIFSLVVGCSKDEVSTTEETTNVLEHFEPMSQGNEAPNGKHYNLNIIGTGEKSADMDNSNGHVIFVPLEGKTKIELQKGDFAVLDANGTDGLAQFQLPDPGIDAYDTSDPGDADTETDYSVFVRPLGKPGGWSTMTTAAEVVESTMSEFLDNKDYKILNEAASFGGVASIEQVGIDVTFREKGKSTFTNVTAELLTILLKIEVTYDDGGTEVTEIIYVRVPLFDDLIENEYWEYDNNGLRLLQVRFYPGVKTDVTDWDS